jgi:tetratricopeptide (TPR) repeat protein
MNCPACDQSNRPGAKRCKICAAPLPNSCLACGTPVAASEAGTLCSSCRTDRVPAALGAEDLFPKAGEDAAPQTAAPYDLKPRFIGRERALERLRKCFDDARAHDELGFAAVIGAPGAGKTRLAKELARTWRQKDAQTRVLAGSAAGQGARPYGVFVRILSGRFGITGHDDVQTSQEKIIAGLSEVLPASKVPEVAHLVAHLMGADFVGSPIVEPLAEQPQQLETRTFIALKRFLAADAERGPLVLCFDDLERAGAETINLIHYLAAGLASSPVLLLVSARPTLYDVHPHFGAGEAALERVDLGPLDEYEAENLFRELMRHTEKVPETLVAHARRLGGQPRTLFELVRLLLETEVIRRDAGAVGGWKIDDALLAKLRLPLDHADILAQRLSHMAPAERDLLEKASVVGEIFWLDAVVALVRVAALPASDPDGPTLAEIAASGDHTRLSVAQTLSRLVEREWIVDQETTILGEREYRFAYPPLWDVVYEGLDLATRRRYHRMVAQWLELRPEGRGEGSQEEVGRHLERAGDGDGAAMRFRRAADAARASYTNDKAIRLYAQALACLGEGDLAARIHLWHDLGSVYELKGDFEAAFGAFERMLRLTWVVSSRSKAAVAFNKMGRVWRRKGDLKLALEYLERGEELFEQAGDPRGIAGSLDDIGQVLWHLGRYDEAFERITKALQMRGKGGDPRSIAHSLSNLGNVQKDRGKYVEAENCYREALELRRSSGDRAGVCLTLNNMGVLAFEHGDQDGARRIWEQSLAEAEAIGALPLQVLCLNNLGELAMTMKKPEEARRRLDETIAIARELDDRRLLSDATRNLGLLELESGNTARARELTLRSYEIAEGSGLRDYVGRALLALGEVHAATLFDDHADSGGEAADAPGPGHRPGDLAEELTIDVEDADGDGGPPTLVEASSTPEGDKLAVGTGIDLGSRSAEEFFRRGIELFRSVGNEGELARGLERYGRYKLERGDVGGGKSLLVEAHGIFTRLGMKAGEDVQKVIVELS